MADDSLFLIDIDRILREKAPSKAKFIPRFAVNYLKRIVHQDELNVFLRESHGKQGVPFLEACMEFLDAHLDIHGEENLPNDGRLCTFVSNHPLGGQDGISLGYILGKHYDGHVKYLVNDLLMNLQGLAPLCIPINKTGRQAKDFPRQVEAGFSSDNHIIMFPAGLCSRRQKGVIRDLEWKKTFIAQAVKHQRDVIPIYFKGHNSFFFYALSFIRKHLGIKVNIELLFLVDEMYKNQGSTFKAYFGEPIPWQTFVGKNAKKEASRIKEFIYEKKDKLAE